MLRSIKRLARAKQGSVAPIVALSLVGLIAAGGLAVDFAQLANLDTELQNAADQSALAGVTQLDGQDGAMQRARAAARALVANDTRFANDANADGQAATVANIYFYASSPDAEADENRIEDTAPSEGEADPDSLAKFIRVDITARQARYAMTPIVGLVNSGNIAASAVAGLGSAICKTPPVMICNPAETGAEAEDVTPGFDASLYIGKGLRLVSVGGGTGGWAPGNFGYLDSNGGSNGAPGLREALGWTAPPGECQPGNGVDTKPGATVTVTDSLNTRFDIYDGDVSCPSGGNCPSSVNVVKDTNRPGNANGGNACKLHNQGWSLPNTGVRYYGYDYPRTNAALPTSIIPLAMGHPRDICHSVGSGVSGHCNGPIGTGVWDRDAYFRTNYRRSDGTYWTGGTAAGSWQDNTDLPANATRYAVYVWEIANRGDVIDGVTVLGPRVASGTGANAATAYGQSQCSIPKGQGAPLEPGENTIDRRRISVAVVNCLREGVNGAEDDLEVVKWIDVFLVEPSINRERTGAGDVYVEVIGETLSGAAGSTGGQVVRRDKPYLVK
ncbi:TadE/TadG family type IV pilus assembly protein [Sphingomonas glaciei]|uniref:Tad domain-containing protein n=1 Tax=Sphingomonas glaciei TaxID=2938948 RepID=A0ABY5MWF5_9SPHN|nr:Tad domain-containing protein [Sphingomonas glaciei]UUR08316.1 Tad domain-containing protein [Sphingomonas glaciei]